MPKYRVLLTSDATCHTFVEVSAMSVRHAEAMALENLTGSEVWTLDDNDVDPYVCDPGNCAEEIEEAKA